MSKRGGHSQGSGYSSHARDHGNNNAFYGGNNGGGSGGGYKRYALKPYL